MLSRKSKKISAKETHIDSADEQNWLKNQTTCISIKGWALLEENKLPWIPHPNAAAVVQKIILLH